MDEPQMERPKTSSRDHQALREQVVTWLKTRVADVEVSELHVPATNGMSSETVMFDAAWTADGIRQSAECVLRLPPEPSSVPVFPTYDMERQFQAMRLVSEQTDVPVPECLWLETDPSHLGAPFFVMRKVDGVVPPDVMPYTFGDNWLFEASLEDQRRVQDLSVDALAQLHTIDISDADFLRLDAPGDTPLRRHFADQRTLYEWVCADGVRSPITERALAWLEDHWPEESPAVLSWGDARIGNILYRDFTPVAVLDWEMCADGPREIDLGWMVFLHRFFQDLTEFFQLPGMPSYMRLDDVVDRYAATAAVAPVDMRWFITYAAMRHATIMFRIRRRQVLFGEDVMPDDPDDAIPHAASLAAMLDGTYWDRL